MNNAGVAPEVRADILEASEESFDRLISHQRQRALLPDPARRQVDDRATQGRRARRSAFSPKIITISSISAYTASVNRGDYCVSKAALSMLTPLYAARLAEHGINVYEIRPGVIRTDMTGPVKEKYDKLIAEGLTPIKRWGTPGGCRQSRGRHRPGPAAVQHGRSHQRGRRLSSPETLMAYSH